MALQEPKVAHVRKTTLVFDPAKQEEYNQSTAYIRKKKVAAYARVSTDQDEQQNSYEAQIRFYTDYIQSKPEWQFVGIYSDEGISGTSFKNRDGFNQMIADAKAGKIDLILTKSISRFARNTVDSLTVTRELKSCGTEVYFEKENISSMDAQAELIFTIMSSIAQEESRSISENVRWGHQRSMEAGKIFVAWSSFLGYTKGPDGLPQIVEEEAKIVRDIYRRFLSGQTFKGIASDLTNLGVKTPTGKQKWSPTTIRNILINEKYIGDARLQKTYTEDFLTKKVKKNNGERKQWYIQDSHDAIISRETFELTQYEIARRATRKGRYHDSPFSGKIHCGACGGFYGHRIWHSNEPCRKEVWLCNEKYDHEEVCRTPAISESEIKKAFLIVLNRIASNRHYCEEFKEKYFPLIGDTSELESELDNATQEKNIAIDNIEHLVAENAKRAQDQDLYQKSYEALRAHIEEKKTQIASIQQQISEALRQKENARIFLQGIIDLEFDRVLVQFDIRTWHTLVDYATIMPNKEIIFHFRNGLEEAINLEELQAQ